MQEPISGQKLFASTHCTHKMFRHTHPARPPKTHRGMSPAAIAASSQKLSTHHRRWVYFSALGLWITGAVWLLAHYFFRDADNLAALVHPAEPWSMKIHGGLAMLFLIVMGSLATIHMRLGWRRKKNRISAAALLAFIGTLMLSGYLLYYASGESLRSWMSVFHWVAGLALPMVLVMHIYLGRKAKH